MMHFEEALIFEFETITGLNDRVFPLYAKEGVQPPFVIFSSSEGETIQTLEGWTLSKEILSEIHVVAMSYGKLKYLTKDVLAMLKTFRGRAIGTGGPFIKSLTYEQPVESLDTEFGFYRTSFELLVRI